MNMPRSHEVTQYSAPTGPRTAQEGAAGLRDVAEVDAGGGDPDQDLARARYRYRRVGDQAQVLRAVQGRLLQGAHGGADAHAIGFLSSVIHLQPGRPDESGKGNRSG